MKKTAMIVAVCCASHLTSVAHAGECKPGEGALWVDKVEFSNTSSVYALAVGLKAQAPSKLEQFKRDYYLEGAELRVGAAGRSPGSVSDARIVEDRGETCLEFAAWRDSGGSAGRINDVTRMDGSPPGVCISPDGSIDSKIRVMAVSASAPHVSLKIKSREPSNGTLQLVFREDGCPEKP